MSAYSWNCDRQLLRLLIDTILRFVTKKVAAVEKRSSAQV